MSKKKSTAAAGRESARELAASMRAEQAARDKRFKIIAMSAFGVAVLALVAAIVVLVVKSQPATLPERAAATTPAVVDASGGIPAGAEGAAGSTNEGAVEVAVYLDYMCPVCGTFEEANAAELAELREAGDITLVMHPVAILDHYSLGSEYSTRAASAAVWVAERSPEHFEAFNAALFAQQPSEGTKGLTDARMAELARDAGVPSDVAEGIASLESYRVHAAWVTDQTSAATTNSALLRDGQFGTPTVTIGGVRWEGNWTIPGAISDAVAGITG